MTLSLTVTVGIISLLIGGYHSGYIRVPMLENHEHSTAPERWDCRPFLPDLFADTPPSTAHPAIHAGVVAVHRYFASCFTAGDIDSLSVAVVTADGPLYEHNFGVTRGNETGSPPTTSHSTYRIASTGKLFPVLEGLILEQRGLISWYVALVCWYDDFKLIADAFRDDPVDKHLKGLSYRLDGLDPHVVSGPAEKPPITLFQLASHMSGLGRDWPAGTVTNWPYDLAGMGPPPTNGRPFPPSEDLFADLVKRDIFDPMGLNGSHFLATKENKHLVVVPSLAPEVADQDFLDAMNPAAGQFSSLSDLITVTQTILNPRHPKSQLSKYSRDKWLLPVHSFEEDDWTELGLMWEIIKAEDSNGLGAMAGYHSALAIHPGTSYGIIVLMAGHYQDAAKLAYDAFALMQPAIDKALADIATTLYAGSWHADRGDNKQASSARVIVEEGTLYMESYTLLGVDALSRFGAQARLALRPSGRCDEFRLDTGIPGYNGHKRMGCYPYWNGQDLWGVRNNAAINALYFKGDGEGRRLHVPSLGLVMQRI
ncbi:hypothetical protein TRAPUB_6853 [Trametes pubescens]|uniref:Beta-lactamase-related domain-containing protein n=1 Tax=Trametes pubescens TaxID=154538 RepID=A0A1M2V4P4_TRAPU|nr:hypothetical protein TRAPUB_6853 [Trametes pubescens]